MRRLLILLTTALALAGVLAVVNVLGPSADSTGPQPAAAVGPRLHRRPPRPPRATARRCRLVGCAGPAVHRRVPRHCRSGLLREGRGRPHRVAAPPAGRQRRRAGRPSRARRRPARLQHRARARRPGARDQRLLRHRARRPGPTRSPSSVAMTRRWLPPSTPMQLGRRSRPLPGSPTSTSCAATSTRIRALFDRGTLRPAVAARRRLRPPSPRPDRPTAWRRLDGSRRVCGRPRRGPRPPAFPGRAGSTQRGRR